jgi:hypothetical protein
MIASTDQPFKWALMVRWPLQRWSVGNATETARLERTKRIVLAAVDQKDRLHGDALKNTDTAKQHVDEKFSAQNMAALYDSFYGYNAMTVTV